MFWNKLDIEIENGVSDFSIGTYDGDIYVFGGWSATTEEYLNTIYKINSSKKFEFNISTDPI